MLDRSLIEIEPRAVSPRRYRLLETLHQYATERLVEMGELETFRARHAAYYQVWATKVIPELQGTNRKSGLDRLEPEHDNLRAALRFLIDRQDADGVSRFCDALTQLWLLRGYIPEGRAWLTEILPLVEASGCGADHARLLAIDGRLAHKQSDWTGSVTRQNQSLAIWRQLGDREGMASELGRLGLTVRAMGDYVAARTFFEESLSLYRELGKEEEAGKQLDRLGVIAFYQGDDATAQAFLAESLKIRRRLGDPYWLGWSLREAGMVAHGQGDLATARSRLEEALLIWRELGYQEGVALALADFGDLLLDLDALAPARLVLTESLTLWRIYGGYLAIVEHDLECLGGLAGAEERVYRAVTLWGAAARLREMLGEPLPPNLKTRLERRMGPVRDALFADAFRQSWLEGQAMTVERAVVYALGDDGPNS
ncbi:MAG TPA: tetratricopeptide repeat protein [Chloroflexota bacterium]|nr:tetratricopeptide repeat protein [Chloroflexota bacterium]